MAVVLTVDQRASRHGPVLAEDWAGVLNQRYRSGFKPKLSVTTGDELQGVARDANALTGAVLDLVRERRWWIGVGFGSVDSLGQTASVSHGEAFIFARDAVESSKKAPPGVAVRGEDRDLARGIETVFRVIAFIYRKRRAPNSKAWQAVDLAAENLGVEEIGRKLDISHQAASERLRTGGWEEERELRWLCAYLVEPLIGT